MIFSQKFTRLRLRYGLTIRDVAAALRVGVGTVGAWASSARPRPDLARRLAELLKIDLDALMDDEVELPPVAQLTADPIVNEVLLECGPSHPEEIVRASRAIIENTRFFDRDSLLRELDLIRQNIGDLDTEKLRAALVAIQRQLAELQAKLPIPKKRHRHPHLTRDHEKAIKSVLSKERQSKKGEGGHSSERKEQGGAGGQ
ncbi:MAG TPA: helix-turn-helix domain-containing protein [Opitutaceae bacterium]|jgi:transcriptional regulator with XRE-family HTH domain